MASLISDVELSRLIVVDGVRIAAQIDAMRCASGRDVVHLHLHAPQEETAARYERRKASGESEIEELASYQDVAPNRTEAQVAELERDADFAVDSTTR